jgi:hypothetical protein
MQLPYNHFMRTSRHPTPALRRILLVGMVLLLLIPCAGCESPPAAPAWTVEDLLLLDPLDAPAPSVEILAVYSRLLGSSLAIRLDLLDLPRKPDYDLELVLFTSTDTVTVWLPARGRPSITGATPGLHVRLARDARLDTVTVRINNLDLRQPFTLQAASFLPGQATPADETAPVRSDALPPLQRASVLIAFWDTFPAFSAAQALRRWDGAHTGPIGGRHGLRYLLDAVETYRLPVALLDLKTPASLAALDFTDGALAQVQRLVARNLLVLPDAAYSQPAEVALDFSREASQDFGLPGSLFAYNPEAALLSWYGYQFMRLPDDTHLAKGGGVRLLPLSSPGQVQADGDGLSLEVRRHLVEAAFSPDPADLVTLGGSLPNSTWGAGDTAGPAFAWLAGHPWVRVLDGYDLMTFQAAAQYGVPAPTSSGDDSWLDALQVAPDNVLTRSAWQAYLMLHSPTGDAALQSLRAVYAGQTGILLAAAAWAQAPASRADCSTDPDLDGRSECILADTRYFAVIETNGARLTHLFLLDENGPHQLVAPTSQFTVGLSDPSEWHPERGDGADPGAVMGAFSDDTGTFDEYRASISGGVLTLVGTDRVKTFRLEEDGLEVTYTGMDSVTLRLPLAVDPQVFYSGEADYQALLKPGSWTWGPYGGFQAVVRSDAELSAQGFSVARVFLSLPEDPDQEYPAGNYSPFPLSLVTVRGEGEFTIWIGEK